MDGKFYTFCLPDIGEGVVEGEVIEWLKNVGDIVYQDEPVVTVMTDKATVELPAPYPGKIARQYYKAGQTAIKDKPLYDIELDASVVVPQKEKKSKERAISPAKVKAEAVVGSTIPATGGEALAVPKVRRSAKEWGIDIEGVAGTGKGGRVTQDDLHTIYSKVCVKTSVSRLEGDEETPLAGIRGLMARKMDQTHIPQFSFFEQTEATQLMAMRHKFRDKAEKEGIRLSYVPFLIRALSLVMLKYPLMNASLDMPAGKVILHKKHNVGIAMATPQGLIVPVLKDVETMGLNDIIRVYEKLKEKVQAGKLTSTDMHDATISISNFGVLGGDGMWATPMVVDPAVAILAFARIREMPIVREGAVVAKSMLPLSWSFDHRVVDGQLAAEISNAYCSLIRNPALLL